jgi:hypothetical protein
VSLLAAVALVPAEVADGGAQEPLCEGGLSSEKPWKPQDHDLYETQQAAAARSRKQQQCVHVQEPQHRQRSAC